MTATQVKHPWRTTVRTLVQSTFAAAAAAPLVYQAATNHSPEQAGGSAALFLAVSAGLTRVMALPVVNEFIGRFAPFLAAAPRPADPATPANG